MDVSGEPIIAGGMEVPVILKYERRKNCSARIGRRGLSIRIPAQAGAAERKRLVGLMREWARERIEKDPSALMPEPVREYTDGMKLRVGSRDYTVRIELSGRKTCTGRLDGGVIRLGLSELLDDRERMRVAGALVSRCVAADRIEDIEARVRELNRLHFRGDLEAVRLKNNRTRWGSCSRRGNINLSTRLLFAPDDVIDYVCIHELAHLVDASHSKRFWRLVENAMPDYKEKKAWLKRNSGDFIF